MGLRSVLCAVDDGVGDWKSGGTGMGAACCVEHYSFVNIKRLSCEVVCMTASVQFTSVF